MHIDLHNKFDLIKLQNKGIKQLFLVLKSNLKPNTEVPRLVFSCASLVHLCPDEFMLPTELTQYPSTTACDPSNIPICTPGLQLTTPQAPLDPLQDCSGTGAILSLLSPYCSPPPWTQPPWPSASAAPWSPDPCHITFLPSFLG